MFFTRDDERQLRGRIRRRQSINETLNERGLSDPRLLGPAAAADWVSGAKAAQEFVEGALPAIREVARRSAGDAWSSRSVRDQAMSLVAQEALSIARQNTDYSAPFMSLVLSIDVGDAAYTDSEPAREAPDWETTAVARGTAGRYPRPLYGRETMANVDECIDVIADSFIFADALATVAPPDIVTYAVSSFGLDRGYPRDVVEIISHLNIGQVAERTRKRTLRMILSDREYCDSIRSAAEVWYLRFGMDPRDVFEDIA